MTLRDTISEAVNTVSEAQVATPEPVEKTTPAPETQAPATEAQSTDKPSRTEGRARDDKGRLLPGKPVKPEPVAAAPTPAPITEPVKKVSPPSSWKKDHWADFEKLHGENPKLADYLIQREGEFAKGVSTYKTEYDSIKPLADAMQPLLPVLRQYNIQPAQWITNMGQAHHSLVFGTPQQKLQMFSKLANDYKVPLQALYDSNAQQQFLMQQTIAPQTPQPDVRELVQTMFAEQSAQQELTNFMAEKDASGNPLYPHFEKVRDDMALLLESGKAQTLKDAYPLAIRLHDDIWAAEQQAKQAATQKAAQEAQAKQVAKAKAAATSPKTATPSTEANAKPAKGIRSAVEAAVEAHGATGRV